MIVILLNVLIFVKIEVLHLLLKYPMGKWHFKNYLKRVDNILESLQSAHVQASFDTYNLNINGYRWALYRLLIIQGRGRCLYYPENVFKGTVSVISSEPTRFSTVPLKPLPDLKWRIYCRFSRFQIVIFLKFLFVFLQ